MCSRFLDLLIDAAVNPEVNQRLTELSTIDVSRARVQGPTAITQDTCISIPLTPFLRWRC